MSGRQIPLFVAHEYAAAASDKISPEFALTEKYHSVQLFPEQNLTSPDSII
jgi:hypothetical protein